MEIINTSTFSQKKPIFSYEPFLLKDYFSHTSYFDSTSHFDNNIKVELDLQKYNIFSSVSAFSTPKIINNNQDKSWDKTELINFNALLGERKNYIRKLEQLDKNWISGNSEIPNSDVISYGQLVLNSFRNYVNMKRNDDPLFKIPKIVLGPIPTGGLGIEFHINHENAMYISLYNTKEPEIDIKRYDYYSTVELSIKDVGPVVLEKYGQLIESRNS